MCSLVYGQEGAPNPISERVGKVQHCTHKIIFFQSIVIIRHVFFFAFFWLDRVCMFLLLLFLNLAIYIIVQYLEVCVGP